MTIKQGEEINKQFTSLNDSLSTLNKDLLELRLAIRRMDVLNTQLSKSLSESMHDMKVVNEKATLYKSSYEQAETDLRLLKRESRNVVTGLLILLGAWTIYTTTLFL